MQRWNIKPSKPAAMLSLVVGIGILIVGLTSFHKFSPFLIVWVLALVGIIGFNLWSAFSSRGSAYSITTQRDDGSGRE
jgi:hypothetical protein